MPEYRFYTKGKKRVVLESAATDEASALRTQGYWPQPEVIAASNRAAAMARFSDIHRENRLDQPHFLASAGAMPWIGVLTAICAFLLRRKQR